MKTLTAVFVGLMLVSGVSLAGGKGKPITHLGVKPNAMVELAASVPGAGGAGDLEVVEFHEVFPDGSMTVDEPFVLPEGMLLIVTDYACGIPLMTIASVGVLEMVAANTGTGAGRLVCKTNLADQLTESGNMTSGAVFSDAPSLVDFSAPGIRGWMRLHGYLINEK